ncbi:phosphatase PAP2 family protein [Streptomyces sp. P9(2023)]|uniref:phosphatase PAP2 family protein n=1 Tax=Streptomyces sp. P9(2023) TaxID=3064394 RepID=UPI0028F401D1|nr:phosphatase PAP2 family protein [Streptomyces sp. P9(2023)]MDT9688913.1 phosphatase PAP2 family protein [Streptomyces sp. P9(2023)]
MSRNPVTPSPAAERPTEAVASARRPGVLVAALLLLGVSALPALAIRPDPANPPFQGLDDQWLAWMGGPHDGLYWIPAAVLNWFGGPLGVVVPLALLFFLLLRRRWTSAGFLLGVYFAGNLLVVQGLKRLVDRPRPANPLVRVDHGSFPSGHVAGAALLVVLVGVLLVPAARRRAWWLGGTVFTLAMMWSRTWLHAHWLTDTAAGAAAGAGAGLLAWWLCAPALARESDRGGRESDRGGRGAAAPVTPEAAPAIP